MGCVVPVAVASTPTPWLRYYGNHQLQIWYHAGSNRRVGEER